MRAGALTIEHSTDGEHLVIPADSDAWFRWLESARAFAFDDASGRFTARKKRRWGGDYWYAFRRVSGRLYETYLGKVQDITLGRLREVAKKLDQIAGRTSNERTEWSAGDQPQQINDSAPSSPTSASSLDNSYPTLTELRAPRVQLSQVVRTTAVDQLGRATAFPLTLVCAPAGYGKTTLLVQWAATSHLPIAWLTVDERNNDPVRFLTRVSAALGRLVPDLAERARPPAEGRGFRPAETLLTAIIAGLTNAPSPTLLVLDDYHTVSADNRAIHEAVEYLVEHLPPHVHLVMASRTVPPLPLAKLRTRGYVLEIGSAELQFTPAETHAFFSRRLKLDLSYEEIKVLHARTEGWVAALQLAALSLQEQADVHQWIAEFSGANRKVFDYLVEEVIRHLPPRMYKFALQTSLLDRLSGPLCDAVTGASNSQAMLEEMERANVFLVPLDDRREWYRFHHLFADVLRHYLRQTQPKQMPQLYARASAWCEAHKLTFDAIDYAFAANELELERTATLLEEYIPTALASGYYALLRDRLDRLPDKLVRERPRLCVAHAYTLFLTGERTLLLRRVREVEDAVTRSAHLYSASDLANLHGEILVLRTIVRFLRGEDDPLTLLASFQQALAALPRTHRFRTYITLYVGILQFIHGDARAASRTLTKLMRSSEAHGNTPDVGYVMLYLGIVMLLQGRFEDALALCGRVAQFLADYGDADLEARIHLIRGKVFYERNDLEQALDHLRHGISLRYDPAPFLTEGFPGLALVWLALGNSTAAHHTIEQCLTEWETTQAESRTIWAWTGRQIRAHQARLWLLDGDVALASAWAHELERATATAAEGRIEPPTYTREWEEIVLARLYIAEGRVDDALALLDALRAPAEAAGRVARLLEVCVLQAIAHDAMGDVPAALRVLRQAVALGAPQRFMRTFVEGGSAIRRLLSLLQAEHAREGASARRRKEARLERYIGSIVAACGPEESSGSHRRIRNTASGAQADEIPVEVPRPTLTPREIEVIRLIADGASNTDIARTLVIAPSTAKRHVSNIFEKLGVGRRTRAIVRARELGILTTEGHHGPLEGFTQRVEGGPVAMQSVPPRLVSAPISH